MENVLTLYTDIHKENEGGFLEVPFTVPENIGEIRIQVSVMSEEPEKCIIDVGVSDPTKVRGWSGGSKYDLTISLDQATPGYRAGEINPGRWAVLLGAYTVDRAGAHVETTITLSERRSKWFRGDLHIHTLHSDGAYTLSEIDTIAKTQDLNFIGLTDHNTVSQNFEFPRESPVTYIPAMELTTYRGHCNLFGVTNPVDDFRVLDQTTLDKAIATAKERGAYVALNHPHDTSYPSCSWQWSWDFDFDWLEVWNGPWRPYNQQTLDWWQGQLESGRKLVAIGGSDTHRPHPQVRHGMPTTWVMSESKSSQALLEAIDQGHVFISYKPTGPTLDFTCGGYIIGDTVPSGEVDELVLIINHLEAGDIIHLISEQGTEKTFTIQSDTSEFKYQWHAECRKFWRVEVWRRFGEVDDTLMAALCNPIYFDTSVD
ncbi:CehA/McbA family metallohydrolase [Alicyclobacillus fastidiosus]|uniref:CehA/McbA family metallohydrolase n=1 Tax=Alicyclobacillus fastidiosus TaxID=392011 RepID=A0ABY6ZBW1_9BACL|nr:CehA/McbA family metallohydrolase [Alicyclobacillus fastidiosus]WAH40027.1 CehA/McbA family metallohydrolase [Alicyclobacillus fastidiosus]GMA61326.1 phosphoesterase [Alicyclobacillus fastidiosus]